MTARPPDRWKTLDNLFSEAVRRTGADRVAFLDRNCANQPSVRAAVERMLWADEAAGEFLENPVVWPVSSPAEAIDEAGGEPDEIGLELGPYRLVELIATGGMGAVYRAERADDAFERAVAVKMVHRRLLRAEDLQRFRMEREVLARLDHPNIARLLDGGTTEDGRPFLVMELVDGLPIDRYCTETGLAPGARVALFQQVCAAVEYAHQNLLIHRDLKPGNILVTADGVVKVLDFGIAKLIEPESLTLTAPTTRTGVRPMTLGYASPEQIRGQPATTRSEVFVLGALLYELLAGRSPFRGKESLPHEIESSICRADGLPAAAGGDATREDHESSRILRGDLGTIVGMALRADPARRYGSVAQLSDDLTRWAEHRPVRARPDSLGYRARTFVRRNRALVSATAVALVGLITLSAALTLQTLTVAGERDRAERALSFVAGIFEGPGSGDQTVPPADPREMLDRGAEGIERELGEHPDMQVVLFEAIGRMYHSLGWYDEARRRLEQSLGLREQVGGDRADLATGLYYLGRTMSALGDFDGAWESFDRSLAIRSELFGLEHPVVAEALASRAYSDLLRGRHEPAEAGIREALRVRRARLGDEHLEVAESWSHLGAILYVSQQDPELVLAAMSEALAIREALLGGEHPLVADALHDVAAAFFRMGRSAEALSLLRRAVTIKRSTLSEDHPDLVRMLQGLGEVARNSGDGAMAEAALREALEIARGRLGELHFDTAHARVSLGSFLLYSGRLDEAEGHLQRALTAYEATYPDGHPHYAALLHRLGEARRQRGDIEGARRWFDLCWEVVESYAPPDANDRAFTKLGRGYVELDAGNIELALTLFEEAAEILSKRPNGDYPVGYAETAVGWARALLGEVEEGRATVVRGLERLERALAPSDVRLLRARRHLHEIDSRLANEDPAWRVP